MQPGEEPKQASTPATKKRKISQITQDPDHPEQQLEASQKKLKLETDPESKDADSNNVIKLSSKVKSLASEPQSKSK